MYGRLGSLDTLLFDELVEVSIEEMLRLVRGIAAGMLHLHKHNIVHRDLAARNILLTSGGEPKISVISLMFLSFPFLSCVELNSLNYFYILHFLLSVY
jgi:serine/threonine protein kinase